MQNVRKIVREVLKEELQLNDVCSIDSDLFHIANHHLLGIDFLIRNSKKGAEKQIIEIQKLANQYKKEVEKITTPHLKNLLNINIKKLQG